MRYRPRLRPGVVAIVLPLIVVACDAPRPTSSQVVYRDSAGIRIAESSTIDRPLPWTFETKFVLGGLDDEAVSFVRVVDHSIKTLSGGGILVLDSRARQVLRFSADGTYLGAVLTEGEGPDEVRLPVAMMVVDSTLKILDPTRYGVLAFSLSGELLGSETLQQEFAARKIDRLGSGLVFSTLEGYRTPGDSVTERLLVKRGDQLDAIASVRRPKPETVKYPGCVSVLFDPLFSPRLVWASNGTRLASSSSAQYSILVADSDGQRMIIRRNLAARQVDEAKALAEFGDGKTVTTPQGRCRIEPEDELEGRGFSPVLPMVDDLAVSPNGEIWVRRRVFAGEVSPIDVFSQDGGYLGTLQGEPTVFPNAFAGDSVILMKTTDDLDVEGVAAYRWSRSSD